MLARQLHPQPFDVLGGVRPQVDPGAARPSEQPDLHRGGGTADVRPAPGPALRSQVRPGHVARTMVVPGHHPGALAGVRRRDLFADQCVEQGGLPRLDPAGDGDP